jgi:hypothetical protein
LVTAFNQTALNISAEDFHSRNPNDFYLVSLSSTTSHIISLTVQRVETWRG